MARNGLEEMTGTSFNIGDLESMDVRGRVPLRPDDTAIHVEELYKKYGTVEAIRGITFQVRQGEIFGLIGPDGAGKTSTFQILAGVMEASSGIANVFGMPAREMRAQSGYLTQGFTLYPDLTVAENIRYTGVLRGIAPGEIERRSTPYLAKFDMLRFRDRLAGRLSRGPQPKPSLVVAPTSHSHRPQRK